MSVPKVQGVIFILKFYVGSGVQITNTLFFFCKLYKTENQQIFKFQEQLNMYNLLSVNDLKK